MWDRVFHVFTNEDRQIDVFNSEENANLSGCVYNENNQTIPEQDFIKQVVKIEICFSLSSYERFEQKQVSIFPQSDRKHKNNTTKKTTKN